MNYTSNTRHQLLQLSYIRTVTIFGQSGLLLYLFFGLHVSLNFWLIAFALLAMALLNLLSLLRLNSPLPLTQLEFFFQLVADIAFYVCLLYQIGGVGNPFSALLLIPLIISATSLPRQYTWLTALLVTLSYTLLMRFFIPITLPDTGHQHQAAALLNLHLVGMWINFILTAILITWFVVNIHENLQRQEHKLKQARESNLRNQQLLSLATMAAGTAHEMGTPLATMRVLLHEMKLDHSDDSDLSDDIDILQSQVENCSDRLKQLAESVRQEQKESRALPAKQFFDEIMDRWQLMRPTAHFNPPTINLTGEPTVFSSIPLQQAFINLLNNAADASDKPLQIEVSSDAQQILFTILDQGPGIPLEQAEKLGSPFITTKGKGLGIGLFLTASALDSYGGEVRLFNHPQGGTLTEVKLPIIKENPQNGH
ncbi:ATP-binding protein [Amphritea sp. 2_MG-2023]|jgi:two-component system sensor histidine kinase RegB|uniref:ATP-binding protein n=1 Tax=Amphritea TaxID=515417 RepID=UPI001C071F4D|nr:MULTISPECIES: ATP-binding protein [Amphritea]MBU2967602.1 sensor histidine kinase [Amphritea atlantica]MDO6419090.1 ATP-binding protein [Amphritea sp. 2_MG-2023]